MSKTISVSVLVPALNKISNLSRCLESIISSTINKKIEIICIINDKTTELKLRKKYPAVSFIVSKATDEGEALSEGLKKAAGTYFSIVRPNDYIEKSMYEILLDHSDKGAIDIVAANYFYNYYQKPGTRNVEQGNKGIYISYDIQPFKLFDHPEVLKYEASSFAVIINKAFFEKKKLSFPSGNIPEYSFWFEILNAATSVFWCSEALYYIYKDVSTEKKFEKVNPEEPFITINNILLKIKKTKNVPQYLLSVLYDRILTEVAALSYDLRYEPFEKTLKELSFNTISALDRKVADGLFGYPQQMYYEFTSPLVKENLNAPRVLIYNWLPFDNQWGWGGGVTVYCKNLIEEIIRQRPDVNIYFLSSGFAYSSDTLRTYVRKIDNIFGTRVRQYEVVNSPVPADQRDLYVNPLVALENESLKSTIKEFIANHGPFEAIHFNNIEGLSLDVLDLKEDFKDTRFIFSIHNYVPMCVNGSYYMRHKHCNCNPKHTGNDCFKCTRMDIRSDLPNKTYGRGLYGLPKEACISRGRWIKSFGFDRLGVDVSPNRILEFAKTATEKINKNCDDILAVSQRVYDIAAENGFDESKMVVNYIGTKVADRQVGKCSAKYEDGLKIVFLGSDIDYEEKGYPFLLDSLSKLEESYASKIDLVLTVKSAEHAEIYTMCKHFRSLKVINGYSHSDLEWIFKDAHLSLVPVLWEDNLPQIAIEAAAYGVPVLTSTAGGAKELCKSDLFSFECGNTKDLLKRIRYFVDNPKSLTEYFANHPGLVTMDQHWKALSEIYRLSAISSSVFKSKKDFISMFYEYRYLKNLLETNGAIDNRNLSFNDLITQVERQSREKEELQHSLYEQLEQLKQEKEAIEKDRDYLLYSIGEIRKSKTYKLAQTMAAIPRTLKGQ